MSKSSGLGDNYYISGYDLSGDINQFGNINTGLDSTDSVTGIDVSGTERISLEKDGGMEFTTYFNDAANRQHAILGPLPSTDVIGSYFRGTTVGNPAASLIGKEANYGPSRTDKGALRVNVSVVANGYGLEWGQMLTAGKKTDVAATSGTSIDTAQSLDFGGQAYLHVFAFTGTDVTVKMQDSADNISFADVAGFAFTQITAAPTSERIAVTGTIRRYVRVRTGTTGGFTNLQFAVNLVKNKTAVSF